MVDVRLPSVAVGARPLRIIFLDLNAYFASVEQQHQPELRGKPVAVCPVMADTSFIIAASYEAKKFGVKTGTEIGEAKRLCPEIKLVPARHALYVHAHKQVLEAVETVLPIEKVCSIDEMRFRLLGEECEPENAVRLGRKLKAAITEHVGEYLTCSVGIAPNAFLAKLATDMQKPDGLVVLQSSELPGRLAGLSLRDFCGINRQMEKRLNAAGLFSANDLIEASPEELRRAFGSVVGERWWWLLRGHDIKIEEHDRQSLGHSHVLPPDLRTEEGARGVMLRLAQKACARLRAEGLWAKDVLLGVRGYEQSWKARTRLAPTQDSVTVTEALLELWKERGFDKPKLVSVTFTEVAEAEQVTPSLFDPTVDRAALSHAIDRMNHKFGKNTVYLAALERAKNTADEKIAFHKTNLFQEGKGDNEWVSPFRGPQPTRSARSAPTGGGGA